MYKMPGKCNFIWTG